MKIRKSTLLVEMVVIFVLSATIGIVWHQKILRDVLTGKPVQNQKTAEQKPEQAATVAPLPLGLMQVKELFDRQEATFVDARSKSSHEAGRIKGSLSLPLEELDTALPRFKGMVKPERTIVVYCNGFDCPDSMDLGNRLIKHGYQNVYVFLGGYPEWKDAGYAVEGSAP